MNTDSYKGLYSLVLDGQLSTVPIKEAYNALKDTLQARHVATVDDDGVLNIHITGLIGDHGPFVEPDQQYTAANLRDDLAVDANAPVAMYIDSPGGFLFTGVALYSQIQRRAATTPVETFIDGALASAATLPAIAGNRITASNDAVAVLIHRGWGITIGNAIDLRKRADQMEATDRSLAALYAKFTGGTTEDMLAVMSEDRLLTANEAKELNLVSAIRGEKSEPNNAMDLDIELAWHETQALLS